MAKNGRNDLNQLEMAGHGLNLLEMAGNGLKWLEMSGRKELAMT